MEALKRGDQVLTTSGMYGTVVNLKGEEVPLRVDDQTKAKVRFVKAAIARIVEPEGTASEPAGEPAAGGALPEAACPQCESIRGEQNVCGQHRRQGCDHPGGHLPVWLWQGAVRSQ